MRQYNYYLNQLKILQDSEFNKGILLSDGQGNKTKNLCLNEESIPILIDFLKSELIRLKELSQNGKWCFDKETGLMGFKK